MSLWTSSVLGLVLLQTACVQAQQLNENSKVVAIDAVAIPAEEPPRPLVLGRRDFDLTQAYFDVFKILSDQNMCSSFYGGPRSATTVLNSFVTRVKSQPLVRDVSFQMQGRLTVVHDPAARRPFRLFQRIIVNTDGSFYQRRTDITLKFPPDVGDFAPGTRAARALILLHELGHLMEGEDGAWLLPDDGSSKPQSEANTLRVQQACRKQLDKLK